MKRKLLASIIGMASALAVTSAHAQGTINLDNYATAPAHQVLYGAGSGGTVGAGIVNGTPVGSTWTIGFYYALGDVTANVSADASGTADPGTLGGGLGFASGVPGDTTTINQGPGWFQTGTDAVINGYTSGLVTIEVVAYNGASYNASGIRGHSTAFTLSPHFTGGLPGGSPDLGGIMPTFSVFAVPEPSTFALAGLGAAALLAFRRKK